MTVMVLAAYLLAASSGNMAQDLRVLRSSAVREEVAEAAVRVAGSGNAAALRKLGDLLTSRAFLARLDETSEPQSAYSNLNQVLLALAAKPSLADQTQRRDERVALARESIVPNRTQQGIIAMVGRLVEGQVESDVALALAETIFDSQAPSWKTASPEARRAATELGRRLLARKDLPAALRTEIEATLRF